MKRILVTIVVVSLIGTAIMGTGCAGNEGQLPTLRIGDQWTYKTVMEGVTYSVTTEVTEEDIVAGVYCYVIEWSCQPAFEGVVESMSARIDQSTNFTVTTQFTGTMMGSPFTQVTDYDYRFPDESWWPLEVGKEITVMETLTMTLTSMGQKTAETKRKTSTYEVVRKEDITVPAGTFMCFKIVEYDTDGKKLSEKWYSDEVKGEVKYIDYDTGETTELKSYSVS